ncbi:aminotransferase class IV [Paenarthrobacter nitroguajacolicus]|uniref:aminotransferase class IV n=1 Tax=Paenarthrobacter nitroguajacolicus TaxID=211146 RepID=UPI001AEA6080|nr:aminotransferase class IV [Paenarthrobacter nitroguajacolicus]MDR6639444.1 branched-chain amino acid aminotransferase [Paenarthrobacter nitroguajacolicus]
MANISSGSAFVDGELVPIGEARIPLADVGFERADCTYDVVGVWDGRFFRLDDHIERLFRGCERLRIKPPHSKDEIRQILMDLVAHSGLRESFVRFTITRGVPTPGERDVRKFVPRMYAYAMPYVWIVSPEQQLEGVGVSVARNTERNSTKAFDPTVKSHQWGDMTRALLEAYDRGSLQALLLDGDGNVTEGPGYNVFALVNGTLRTPEYGVLEGITRRSVLEIAEKIGLPTKVDTLAVSELQTADEVFLTSTAGGIIPITYVDHHEIGSGRPGDVTLSIRDMYWDMHTDAAYTDEVPYVDFADYGAGRPSHDAG